MFGEIIAGILILAALVQTIYVLFLFLPALSGMRKDTAVAQDKGHLPTYASIPVSVIICAHNEAANLKKNLGAILDQNYQNSVEKKLFEVIVVNDRSDDGTAELLQELAAENAHLKVVTIDAGEARDLPGKKFALSRGMKAARYNALLMTDADCKPASSDWIRFMSYPFLHGKEIVGGFGNVNRESSALNLFARMETLHTFVQYFSYAHAKMPYMAVGRNLACKKELLLKAQEDPSWSVTASGDDDLLINLFATKENLAINTEPGSFTCSEAKDSTKDYLRQKQRHVSTGKLYQKKQQLFLGAYAMAHFLFWIALILILGLMAANAVHFSKALYSAFYIAMIGRCLLFWSVLYEYMNRLWEDHRSMFAILFFDIGWAAYNFVLSPYILWKNRQAWK